MSSCQNPDPDKSLGPRIYVMMQSDEWEAAVSQQMILKQLHS